MSGDADAMAQIMGFTSFGQHRRRKPSRVEKAERDGTTARGLPQLMPGTELVEKCTELSVNSIEKGLHGVVSLLCTETSSAAGDPLETALAEGVKKANDAAKNHLSVPSYLSVLEELEQEKHKFHEMEHGQFLRARGSTNAFETLGRHRFLNRSAMKLVTLDHIFQWTRGVGSCPDDSFSFADICGGPGGFCEYLLWRVSRAGSDGGSKHERAYRGYGITLKDAANSCDWRLPSAFQHLFTRCDGEDGTGNIYSVANIHTFRDVVRARQSSGVDLVVADGGFPDARSQCNQESMLTKLVVAEVLAMFAVLRVGGDFVCKTFEVTTPTMMQMCWILHRCFGRFAVVKPITSRPASSERYIVARGLRASRCLPKLVRILEDRLAQSGSMHASNVSQFPPFLPNSTPMHEDVDFYKYMSAANEAIAISQVRACRRINQFRASGHKRKRCEDGTSVDPRQYYQCWQLGARPQRDSTG
ncbi:unnamed protein product [Hyaloperonospora brassicae]|uniref:Cap-specific mRNA (nucleoside-2'-O-)-methyltransferase 1 n=1 Tax=Hyaloperonospora brassicae TaxID=162125 RepID=A0AAV0TNM3_HYABA|nr:unnamed protein product [Hyaloperonospora brassicae]